MIDWVFGKHCFDIRRNFNNLLKDDTQNRDAFHIFIHHLDK